jgi:hypothetical protein
MTNLSVTSFRASLKAYPNIGKRPTNPFFLDNMGKMYCSNSLPKSGPLPKKNWVITHILTPSTNIWVRGDNFWVSCHVIQNEHAKENCPPGNICRRPYRNRSPLPPSPGSDASLETPFASPSTSPPSHGPHASLIGQNRGGAGRRRRTPVGKFPHFWDPVRRLLPRTRPPPSRR